MRKPRWFIITAFLGVLAVAGAACGGDDGGSEFSPGPKGAVTVAPGEPIKIASMQSISGETASLGTDQVTGIEIAIDDKGEVLGHSVTLQSEDDGCAAEQGTTAATKIAADPQIVGVVGTSCSGAAVPAAQILTDAGIVLISGSNTSPTLTSDLQGTEAEAHQDYYFRTAHNDLIQGRAAATFAIDNLQAATAVTIHDGDPYTEGLANAFGTAFTELGGEVVLATAISKGDTDMRPVLTEVAAADPDLVFFPIFQPEADFIVQQAPEFPELSDTERLMGADGLLSDTFVVIPETEGMYFSGPATPEGGAYDEFVTKYEEKAGTLPIQAFHAHAYDATTILLNAIEAVAVQDDDGTLHIDREALRNKVAETSGFEGLTGTLTCDDFGDCAAAKIDVVQNTEAQETINDVKANILFTFVPEE